MARSQTEDGTLFCQKYNKPLVDEAPVEDVAEFQRHQLHMADASDAEVTAAMFNPAAEFGLHNDVLDSFDLESAPEIDKMAEYTFGGMEWSDE